MHVGDIKQPDDAGEGDVELEKKERTLRVEQDAKIQTTKHQTKEAGAGTGEPQDKLNQDG